MKVIQEMAEVASQVFGKQERSKEDSVRFLTYCVATPCDDGVLLYNVLTKELLLLESEESECINYNDLTSSPILLKKDSELFRHLYDNYFIVPQNNDDKGLCLNLRSIARELREVENEGRIIGYTILTTTDCNARCFYCYEKGARRQNMTDLTAHRVVEFIKTHCGGRKVTLSWFGGEPLYNTSPIDIISQGLRSAGIDYSAGIITNGYLFDDSVVAKAVEQWNLKHVQITLDGTEEVYNRRKAYIYREGSAFRRVTDNIERLLKADIRVSIRLNMDSQNYDDLKSLIDQLICRFGHYKQFHIYVALLSDGISDEPCSGDLSENCHNVLFLRKKLKDAGMVHKKWFGKGIKTNSCMADRVSSVVIQTDGALGRCQHYYDSRPCGNLDEGINDMQEVAHWCEADTDSPLCDHCALYPECYRISACQGVYKRQCKEVLEVSQFEQKSLVQSMLRIYNEKEMYNQQK